jgi:hypothetical protein
MKKLLSKITPEFLIKVAVKNKYKKYNIEIHTKNIENDNIVEIKCNNKEKYIFLKKFLFKAFGGVIKIREYKFYFHPVAIIKVPETIDIYLKDIGAKSRNMNRKAEKNNIFCKIFNWNEKLDDIFEINTSSEIRQGRKMDDSYRNYPKKIIYPDENDFNIVHIGAFVEEKLVGYIELYIYGNFAMINKILGHKNYLKFGVMNLMIKHCVEYAIEVKNIKYINYLTMQNRKNNSLSAFKYRVGFREYSLLELK